jgi:uncharacterized protein YdeI (YjbR/CyaY-like superfamily)
MPKPATSTLPQVDDYIAKSAPFAQPILMYLREIVQEAAPGVIEEIKWSRPFFVYNGVILGNLSAFKNHCSFGLWGSEIAAALREDGVASSEGMGTFGRITTFEDLPPRRKLVSYVKTAAKKIADGERTQSVVRTRVAKGDVKVPAELEAALKQNKAAAKKFAAMSTSSKREYTDWIASAKREDTRTKRLATVMEWITAGKQRHWQHQ